MANLFFDMPETKFAHPNFVADISLASYKLYDYYSAYQPHAKMVIGTFNEASVWDFAGLDKPITVAIIDNGVASHEDLPSSRLLAGYDVVDEDSDARPAQRSYHGMGCAGIVSASHTTDTSGLSDQNSGIIGLNPHVKILPVKIFSSQGYPTFDEDLIQAINWAKNHGADILSNSWNYTDPDVEPVDLLEQAISSAQENGRNWFGAPVIFSAGNLGEGSNKVLYPARVAFAVGAVDLQDSIWPYSSSNPTTFDVDLVAPSGDISLQGDVYTIDQMSDSGCNRLAGPGREPHDEFQAPCDCAEPDDLDYDCKFGGTSTACPAVAGVASLLLSRDPELLRIEVEYILRESAVRVSSSVPDHKYGYGRVDAFRAVLSIAHGDASNDAILDISDLATIVDYLFYNGQIFPSPLLGDCDCDSDVDITDLDYFVAWFFGQGGNPPVKPCFQF